MYVQRCMPGRSRRRSQDRDNGSTVVIISRLAFSTSPPPPRNQHHPQRPLLPFPGPGPLRYFSPKRTQLERRDAPRLTAPRALPFVSRLYLLAKRRGEARGKGGEIKSDQIVGNHRSIEQRRRRSRNQEGDGGGVSRGGGVRLPVQGGADRGQRRGQVQPAVALRQGRVQPRHQVHHRRRVRHQDRPRRRQARQGADLGHRRPRKVPGHHQRLLPGRRGRARGVRRDAPHHVRERGAVADGAAGPHGRQHRGDAGREQGGPAPPAGRLARGGQGLRGAPPHLLHGDVRAGGHQRGGRLHGGARRDLPRRKQEGPRHRRRPRRAAQGQDHRRRRQGRRHPGEHGRLLLGLVKTRLVIPCCTC